MGLLMLIAKPAPEVKQEEKPRPVSEIKAEKKPEPVPAAKPEKKAEPVPEIKQEEKPEPIPEVKPKKAEPVLEVKQEKKPEPIPEPKPVPETKPARKSQSPKAKREEKPQVAPELKDEETLAPQAKAPRAAAKKAPKAKRTKDQLVTASSSPGTMNINTTTPLTTSTVPPPQPSAESATASEKAQIIFGSRLAGPAERADRLQSIRDRSVRIAGVLVPPRPEEPENCCMSGCVNCVWDRYRDEMEEWATASKLAEKALQAERARAAADAMASASTAESSPSSASPTSMDDDGGGSETNWQIGDTAKTDRPKIAKDFWDDDLYNNIPVGIREFMKHEKRLKEKHQREGTIGG
ncbi:oxidoreductase-like protein [Xylaria sp. CBS 124048]|nr:oxidoreductase-like protein [Xylaria sp. CBS 124048]